MCFIAVHADPWNKIKLLCKFAQTCTIFCCCCIAGVRTRSMKWTELNQNNFTVCPSTEQNVALQTCREVLLYHRGSHALWWNKSYFTVVVACFILLYFILSHVCEGLREQYSGKLTWLRCCDGRWVQLYRTVYMMSLQTVYAWTIWYE